MVLVLVCLILFGNMFFVVSGGFFLLLETLILNLCQEAEVFSLNEKHMQETQPRLNFSEPVVLMS